MAFSVTRESVGSYPAFPPLLAYASGISLLHYLWSHLHRTLSGTLPCEARTFLFPDLSVTKGSDHLSDSYKQYKMQKASFIILANKVKNVKVRSL